jgi:CBS domain-containing protein
LAECGAGAGAAGRTSDDPQSGHLQSRGNHEQHHGADDRRQVSAPAVVEEGQLVGIVSIGDVVKHRVQEIEFESVILRDYIRTA